MYLYLVVTRKAPFSVSLLAVVHCPQAAAATTFAANAA
jgi:hypothetical protein